MNNLGCKVKFEKFFIKIYDTNGKLIGKGNQTRGNILYLDIEDATCLVVEFDDVWLWHKMLYHVNLMNWLVSIT